MAQGRKPKPTALKIVEGNPGRRKLPEFEPKFDPAQPTPPPFLNDDAKVVCRDAQEKKDLLRRMNIADYENYVSSEAAFAALK